MFRKSFLASLVVGFAALAGAGSSAKAQYYAPAPVPGHFAYGANTLGELAASNIAFDQQFDRYNWYMSQQIARNMRPGEKLPFNAMTISKSISEGNQSFQGYMGAVQQGSNRQIAAIERWNVGAVQSNWYYSGGYGGPSYVLPYTQNSYYVQNGYIYPGYQQGGYNIYPR
jgi:hypothetical protein